VFSHLLSNSCANIRANTDIHSRWFGLILLPVVSFAADGVVAIVYFAHSLFNHLIGKETLVPSSLAKARAIDLSIQFTLFWMPFLVLLGWWIDKPMHLLFGERLISTCMQALVS
jgi:Ca2+:H+ antiporter